MIAAVAALTAADRAALLDLWIRGWSLTFPAIDFAAQRPWLSDHLDRLMAGGATLLVHRPAEMPLDAFLTVHPQTGDLDQLAVDPDHAGRGLGRALIAEAKRRSPAGLTLRVNKANTRAVALYANTGFVVTGEDVSARSGLPVWCMAWPRAPSRLPSAVAVAGAGVT